MRAILFSLISCLFLFSCNFKGNKKNKQESEIEKNLMMQNTEKMKRVFMMLPSPLEISLLVKKAGIQYDKELLNPVSKIDNYNTSSERAIALGIYCADLCYASLNQQYQTSLEYIGASKQISESLGVMELISKERVSIIENNLTNIDVVVQVMSDIYTESSNQFKEQDRYPLAALMIIGGWVESLYIATQDIKINNKSHDILIKRILDQEMSLEGVKQILRDNLTDDKVKYIHQEFVKLEALFKKSVNIDPEKLSDKQIIENNKNTFNQLVVKVADLRKFLTN
ncbi:MAG: hypothetical protein N4A49_03125 [Marinifilaceae bacterium]|jgi:hypothetical protein|nr:hypothetical protein [Marinifilaceae bacterium]